MKQMVPAYLYSFFFKQIMQLPCPQPGHAFSLFKYGCSDWLPCHYLFFYMFYLFIISLFTQAKQRTKHTHSSVAGFGKLTDRLAPSFFKMSIPSSFFTISINVS